MVPENKSNTRQRKKSDKSNEIEQVVEKRDSIVNGDENSKQKKQ